jgi:hypothetical protein
MQKERIMPRSKVDQLQIKNLLHVLSGSWFRNWFRYGDRYWLTKEKSLVILKSSARQDFGYDVKAWRKWFDDHPDFEFEDNSIPPAALPLADHNETQSWDEISNLYKILADKNGGFFSDLGKDMLNAIQLLRSDPDIARLQPGYSLFNLLIVSHSADQRVTIQWLGSNRYRISLIPKAIEKTADTTLFPLNEIVPTVKELLQQPPIKQEES